MTTAGHTTSTLSSGDLQFAEWRGASAFAIASTGKGAADFVQIALGRETEWLAGPIVDPNYRPFSADALFEPSWVSREARSSICAAFPAVAHGSNASAGGA